MNGLRERLIELYADSIGWPCLGNPLWVSDDPEERRSVAPMCLTCRALIECRLEADTQGEDFGIWAGEDRGIRRKIRGGGMSPPLIEHAARCRRRRPPILRAAWDATPEVWCPECGRSAPAVDQRTPIERNPA
jgi:hypothetical protein